MTSRTNALAGWAFAGAIIVGAIAGLFVGQAIWSVFALFTAAVLLFSAVGLRDWKALTPWPLVALASCATLAVVGGFYRERAVFVAIAAVAIVIVIQLQVFSDVTLSGRFAILFAGLTTMALEAVWILVQALADVLLGTSLIESQVQLQWEIVYVTVIAVLVGVLYRTVEVVFRLDGTMTAKTDGTE